MQKRTATSKRRVSGGQRQGVWALVVGAEQTRPACESVGRVEVDG